MCDMCGVGLPPGRKRYCSGECRRRAMKEYNREYGERRKAAGLCRYCGLAATPGRATCGSCRGEYRRRMKARVAEWRRDGVCGRCGRARRPGRRYCHLCLEYMRAWRERH